MHIDQKLLQQVKEKPATQRNQILKMLLITSDIFFLLMKN